MFAAFKERFWLPPRAHGDVIEDRTVGFIELFYDLVYVVVIARAAHHLAEHLTWRGVSEFAVVFGMIWLAWLNGSFYHDLHGREDGRSRTYIFLQMGILAVLGVYTADAGSETGRGFAITYTVFLLLLTWMWYTVRRQDAGQWASVTARYLTGMGSSVVIVAVSTFLPDTVRVMLWAAFLVAWVALSFSMRNELGTDDLSATDSTVERFGLFTIIVLGEVVVGVVTGLSEADRSFRVLVTGLIGLGIGFGAWWTYFDFVGRRHPRSDSAVQWVYSHLPISMGIAATGAALVSLVEHAGDQRAPVATAWVLTGSIALVLVGLTSAMSALEDYRRLASIYRPLTWALAVAVGVVVLIGWWRPVPWLLVLALFAVLSAVWWFAVDRWLRLPNPDAALPGAIGRSQE
ncbi:MAG: low temperature requirement protein A [Acidimicrobiia bacterium]|nr:low temperature requirement protein A [Acidimicrobiia bacterium]